MRGMERIGFEALSFGFLDGVRVGLPAMEAWIVEVRGWRCVPGPGV